MDDGVGMPEWLWHFPTNKSFAGFPDQVTTFNLTIKATDIYESFVEHTIVIEVYNDELVTDVIYDDVCTFVTSYDPVLYPSMDYVEHFPNPYKDPDQNRKVLNLIQNETTYFISEPALGLNYWGWENIRVISSMISGEKTSKI